MPDKKLIYIADDEVNICNIIKSFLVKECYEVETFNDGRSILEAFNKRPADMLVIDIMMPELDGFGLFEKIKAEDLLKDVKVFIWSNLTQKKDKERAEKLKIDGYLVKSDYTPASLAMKLKNILN